MPLDFTKAKIEVRYKSLDYGPFSFDFEDAFPGSETISAITLRSFLGRVDQKDDLGDETETTSELVDATLTVISGSYGVVAYFNYPTTAAYQNEDHTLVFEITFAGGGTHSYYFQYVRVTDQGP